MAGDMWKYAVITTKGLLLQSKVATGGSIDFTKVKTGAGTVEPVLLQAQTDVTDKKQEFIFSAESSVDKKTGQVSLVVVINNENLTTGYDCYQVGVYATDPDDGEILYAIMQSESALAIPSEDSLSGWIAEMNIGMQYGNAETVNITMNQAGVASKEEFYEHANNKENPHGVTAEQVGARPNTWMPTASDVGAVTNLLFFNSGDIKEIAFANQSFFSIVANAVTGMPFYDSWWSVESNRRENFVVLKATNLFNGATYIQTYVNGAWLADWVKDYSSANPPTASDVGALPYYTTLESLGLSIPTNIADVFEAMPNGSEFVYQNVSTRGISDIPIAYSLVVARKQNGYGEVEATAISNDGMDKDTYKASWFENGVMTDWWEVGDFKADGSVAMTGSLKTSGEFQAANGYNQFGGNNEGTILGSYKTLGSLTGRRWFALWNENRQKEYALQFGQSDGQAFNIYGTHNVTKGTDALTSGISPLSENCIYLQYE